MIVYIENSTDTTHTHTHTHKTRTNQWIDQIAGYKINIQKSVTFPYTNNENHQEEKLKKIIPFTIASQKRKYLGINLTKEVKDLHSEKNY